MARKLYEKQAVRRRNGQLANGVALVVYTDEAGTVLADVSATSGGSAIAGSTVTTADIAGLGPASLRFYGPTDGTDTLYMRVPSDASLGVQKIEADPDPRLDLLEAGVTSGLAAHEADTTVIHGIADTTKLALKPATTDVLLYLSGSGNDSNDGLSWGSAMRTPQAAYDALPSGGGTLLFAPARYDVFGGLVLNRNKQAVLQGAVRTQRYYAHTTGTFGRTAAVFYSSLGAFSLVYINQPVAFTNGYGFEFRNLVFEVTAATTLRCIQAPCVCDAIVDDCQFWAASTGTDDATVGIEVYVDPTLGDDASWWRVTNNVAAGMALGIFGNDGGTAYNANQHVVTGNHCMGRGIGVTAAKPAIRFRGNHRSVSRDNNLEIYAIGEQWQDCWNCTSDGNSGEGTPVFCDLLATVGSKFLPIGIATPNLSPTARLIRADNGTVGNVFVVPGVYDVGFRTYAGTSVQGGLALTGNAKTNNTIIAGRFTQFGLNNRLGLFSSPPVGRQTLPAAATDPTTTMTLANSLRTALLNLGVAPYVPTSIPDLALWLKADAITSLADADPVATWSDSSGVGNNATQGTAGKRPTYRADIPVVRFLTDDLLSSALSAAPTVATIFVVGNVTAIGAAQALLGASTTGGLEFRISATGKLELVKEFTAVLGASTTTLTAGAMQIWGADYIQAGAFNFFLNGTADGASTSALTLVAATTLIGGLDGADQFSGDIAEVLVYARVLSTAERQDVQRYLGNKYGVTVP